MSGALTASGDTTLSGVITQSGTTTFSVIPTFPASNPTTDNQAARKAYVDDSVEDSLGGWVSRTVGTYYTAATAGFVTVYCTDGATNGSVSGYTPTSTIRVSVTLNDANPSEGVSFPVAKGASYRGTCPAGVPTANMYWIPLE